MLATIAHTSLAIQCSSKEPPTERATQRSHLSPYESPNRPIVNRCQVAQEINQTVFALCDFLKFKGVHACERSKRELVLFTLAFLLEGSIIMLGVGMMEAMRRLDNEAT